jgi:cobalamin biosynthesis protein CobD/CbiB
MYDILELAALPRDGNVLRARIHQHRYARRRARRRRIAGTIALIVLVVMGFVCWPQLQPITARFDGYQLVAIVSGIVFVVSTVRLIRKRRRVQRSQPAGGMVTP